MYESSQSSDFDSDNVLITQKRVKKRPLSPPLTIPPPTSKTETTSTTIIPHPHHSKTTTTTTTTQTTTNIARQYDVVEGHERRKTTTTTTITTTQVIVVDDIEILEDDISISRPDPPSLHDIDTSRLDPESVSRIDPPSLHVEEEEDVDVSQIGSVHISHGDDEDDDILPTHTTPLRHNASPPPKQPYSPHNGENKPNSKPSSPKNLTAIPPSVTSSSPSKSPVAKRNSLTKQTKNKKSFVDKLRGRLRSSYQSMPGQNTKPSPTLRELDPIKSEPVSLPSIDDAVRILQRGMIMTIYLKHRVNLPPRAGTPSKQPISPKVGSGKQTTPWSDGGMTVIHSRRIFLWGQVFLDESSSTTNHNDNHNNKSPTHDLSMVDGSGAIIGDSNNRWNRELKTHLHRHALYWTELEEPKPTHKKKASANTNTTQQSSQQSSKKPHPTPSHSKHPSQSTIPSLSRSVSMPMPIHQPSKQMERNMSPIPTSSHPPVSSSPPGGLEMDVLSTSPQRDPFDMTSLSRTSPAPGIASNQSMTPITSNPSSHPSSGAISPELKGASIPMEGMALDSFALDDADDWVSPPVSPSNMPQPAPAIPPSTPPLTGSTPPTSSSPPRVDRTPSITHGNTIRRVLDPGHCLPFTQISDLYLGQKTQTFQIFQQLAALPPSQRPTGLPSFPAVDLSFSVESVSPENNLHVSTANKDTRNSFFFAIYRFLMEIQQGIMTLEEDSFKKQQLAEMNAMGMDM